MKILVTGGGGFLGRYIVQELITRGQQVSIFGRSPQPDLTALGIKTHLGDIADAQSINKVISNQDAIFHVAAKAGIWGSWDSYYSPNVQGTQNILKACKVHRIPYLVYTSTPSVVFNGEPLQNVDESMPYGKNWLCHYAHTKAIAEQEILAANSPSLKTIALRPHLIWGKGDNHLIPHILQQAKAKKLKIIGEGNNLVDITHVKNAAHAHLLALDALQKNTTSGKPYFISQGQPIQLFPWINNLLQLFNISPITQKISFKKAYLASYILESWYKCFYPNKQPQLTRFLATELAKDHYFNISNAIKDLSYKPIISINEGLMELIASYH